MTLSSCSWKSWRKPSGQSKSRISGVHLSLSLLHSHTRTQPHVHARARSCHSCFTPVHAVLTCCVLNVSAPSTDGQWRSWHPSRSPHHTEASYYGWCLEETCCSSTWKTRPKYATGRGGHRYCTSYCHPDPCHAPLILPGVSKTGSMALTFLLGSSWQFPWCRSNDDWTPCQVLGTWRTFLVTFLASC